MLRQKHQKSWKEVMDRNARNDERQLHYRQLKNMKRSESANEQLVEYKKSSVVD